MGSLIVYKNLMNSLKNVPAPVYLLTIGSMLGERAVQRTLLGSLSEFPAPVPLPVFWWRNILNRGDLLAFRSHDAFVSTYPAKMPRGYRLWCCRTIAACGYPHAIRGRPDSPVTCKEFGRAVPGDESGVRSSTTRPLERRVHTGQNACSALKQGPVGSAVSVPPWGLSLTRLLFNSRG